VLVELMPLAQMMATASADLALYPDLSAMQFHKPIWLIGTHRLLCSMSSRFGRVSDICFDQSYLLRLMADLLTRVIGNSWLASAVVPLTLVFGLPHIF
jgi:hypothetical protein